MAFGAPEAVPGGGAAGASGPPARGRGGAGSGSRRVWRERWYRAAGERRLAPLSRRASYNLPIFADLIAVPVAATSTSDDVRSGVMPADAL
jgi:hypothetical protein